MMKPECSTCQNLIKKPIPGRGIKPNPIMIVGRNPGKTEALTYKVFSGQAGFTLGQIIRATKIPSPYITNLVKCPTPHDDRPLTSVCQLCAKLFLEDELEEVQPKLILSLGEECLNYFFGVKHIMEWRGYIKQDPGEPIILFTLHPAYIKRGNPEFFQIVAADFEKGLQTLEKGGFEDEPFTTEINPNRMATELYLQKWGENGFTFDIETGPWETALNPRLGNIKSIAICGQNDVAFSIEWGGENTELISRYLKDPNIPKVAQNAPFDIGFLRSKGVDFKGLTFDTSLASHTLCSDLPKRLTFQRSIYTNIPPYKSKEKGKPREVTQKQGCLDALVTYRAWKQQDQHLKEEGLDDFYYNWYLPKLEFITTLNLRGVHIDKNQLIQAAVPYSKKLKDLVSYFNGIQVNPNSPKQVGDFLVKKLHIPLMQVTKSGQWQVTEEILQKALKSCMNQEQRDVVTKLIEWSGTEHEFKTYVKGVYQRLEGDPPKIYTTYNISGAATGRLSSENPNLQNVPVPLRRVYIPPEGCTFIGIDYKQLELTIAALLAGEEYLLESLRRGEDIHDSIAVDLFHIPPGTATHDQRIIAKKIVFGTLYGASPQSLAKDSEINQPTSVVKVWQNRCMGRFPKLVGWRENIKMEAQQNGYLTNLYGRRRYFFEDKVTTKAYNFPVQSAASDLVLEKAQELENMGFRINLPVHDFYAIEIPEGDVEHGVQTISSVVSAPHEKFGHWSFKTKIKIGKNWEEVS